MPLRHCGTQLDMQRLTVAMCTMAIIQHITLINYFGIFGSVSLVGKDVAQLQWWAIFTFNTASFFQ